MKIRNAIIKDLYRISNEILLIELRLRQQSALTSESFANREKADASASLSAIKTM